MIWPLAALATGLSRLEQLLSRILYYHGVFCGTQRAFTLIFSLSLIIAGSFPVYLSAWDSAFGTSHAAPFRGGMRRIIRLDPGPVWGPSSPAGGSLAAKDVSDIPKYALATRISWNCVAGDGCVADCKARNVTSSFFDYAEVSDLLLGLLVLETAIETIADPVTGKKLADICYRSQGNPGACVKLSPSPYFLDPRKTSPPPAYAIRNPSIDKDFGNVHSASSFVLTYFIDGRGNNAEVWWRIRGALLEAGLAAKAVHSWDPPLERTSNSSAVSAEPKAPRIEPQTTLARVQFFSFSFNHLIIAVSYLTVFLYISLSLGRIELVKSKFGLGIAAITTVFGALTMSMGILDIAGVTIRLMQWEVLPFLIIAVGVENIFVITNAVSTTSIDLPVNERIGRGLGKVGVSIIVAVFGELCLFVFGTLTSIPAAQEFSLFASVAVVVDFFLQITFFATVLSIDVRRLELSDLSHRRVAEIIRQSSAVDLVAAGKPVAEKNLQKAPSDSQMKAAEVNEKLAREKVAAKSFQQRTTILRYVLMVFLALFAGFLFIELLAKNAYRPAMSVFSSYDQVDLDYSHSAVDDILESAGEHVHPFIRGYKWIEWTESLAFFGPSLPAEQVLGDSNEYIGAVYKGIKAQAAFIAAESHPFGGRRFPKAAMTTLEIVAVLILLTTLFVCWTNFLHRWITRASPAEALALARDWLQTRLSSDRDLPGKAGAAIPPSPKDPALASRSKLSSGPSWWELDHSGESSQAAAAVLSNPWTVGTATSRLPDLSDQEHDLLGHVCLVDWGQHSVAWVRNDDRFTLYVGEETAIESSDEITAIRASRNSPYLALGRSDGRVWLVETLKDGEIGLQMTSDESAEANDSIFFIEFLDSIPNNMTVLSVTVGGVLLLWKREGERLVLAARAKTMKGGRVTAAAFTKAPEGLVIGFEDGALERYNFGSNDEGSAQSFTVCTSWDAGTSKIVQLEVVSLLRPNESAMLLTLAADGTIKIWNISSHSEAAHLCTIDPSSAPAEASVRPPRMAVVVLEGPESVLLVARKQADRRLCFWRVVVERARSKRRDSSRSSRTSTSADDLLVFKSSRNPRSSTPPLAPIKTQSNHHRRTTAPSVPSPLVNLGLGAMEQITAHPTNSPFVAMSASPVLESVSELPEPTETPSPLPLLSARATAIGGVEQRGCSAILGIKDLELTVGIRRRAIDLSENDTAPHSFLEGIFGGRKPREPKLDPAWVWEAFVVDARSIVPAAPFAESVDPNSNVLIARTIYLADDKLRGIGCSEVGEVPVGEIIVKDECTATVRAIRKVAVDDNLRARFAGGLPVLSVRSIAPATTTNGETWGFCCDFGDSVKKVMFQKEAVVASRQSFEGDGFEDHLSKILDAVEQNGQKQSPVPTSGFDFDLPKGAPAQFGGGTMQRRAGARRADGVVPVPYNYDTDESTSCDESEDLIDKKGAYAFRLKEKKVLTSLKVAELIKAVEILWFHEFGTRQKFAVEPITDGGLLFKDIEGYKSFRLMITGWPGIYPNVDYYEKWSNPTEPVLDFKQPISDYPYHFFIKAREGAPLWTRREVEVFAVAFTQIGFKVIKTSLQGICVRWFNSKVALNGECERDVGLLGDSFGSDGAGMDSLRRNVWKGFGGVDWGVEGFGVDQMIKN